MKERIDGKNRRKETGRPRAICGQQYLLPCFKDCELELGEAGQRPQRGRSPVEHRGTFVRPTEEVGEML